MNLIQKIISHYSRKLPFVVFCKPGSDTMIGVFQQDDALHPIIDFSETGFAFVSFDGKEKYFIPSEISDVHVEKVTSDTFYVSGETGSTTNRLGKESFELLVNKGIDAIKNGNFKKVVLSRKETFEMKDLDFGQFLNNLYLNYPNAFKYCFFHPGTGLWTGATPEQLLQVKDNKIKTVALAGTQVFSEVVSWETKEREEQQFVTDFILESLKQYCHGIHVSEPYTFRAGNIVHIKTDISAVLKTKNELGNLIDLLHPTPAVCGLPKEAAKQFIIKNENYDRKFYTGFLGELNIDFSTFRKQNSDLFVNLRCMEAENGSAHIYVGCGVTKDSIPEKEYIETVNKSMTIRKVVNLTRSL